jgi:hypothetical protein
MIFPISSSQVTRIIEVSPLSPNDFFLFENSVSIFCFSWMLQKASYWRLNWTTLNWPKFYLGLMWNTTDILRLLEGVSFSFWWLINFSLIVLGGGPLRHLQRFLQYINYTVFEFISSTVPLPLISSPQIHGIVKTGITIAFTCMCTHFLHCIYPPNSFLHYLPTPPPHYRLVPIVPCGYGWFCTCVLRFCRREKRKEKNKNVRVFGCLR